MEYWLAKYLEMVILSKTLTQIAVGIKKPKSYVNNNRQQKHSEHFSTSHFWFGSLINQGLVWDFLLQVLQELILDSNDLVQFMQWSLGLDGQRASEKPLLGCWRTKPPFILPTTREGGYLKVGANRGPTKWDWLQFDEFALKKMRYQGSSHVITGGYLMIHRFLLQLQRH